MTTDATDHVERTMQFDQAGFGELLRLAIDNRGRDWAKGLLIETVMKNPDAFLDLHASRAALPAPEPVAWMITTSLGVKWDLYLSEQHAHNHVESTCQPNNPGLTFRVIPLYSHPVARSAPEPDQFRSRVLASLAAIHSWRLSVALTPEQDAALCALTRRDAFVLIDTNAPPATEARAELATNFHESFDARVWAEAFVERSRRDAAFAQDEGTIIGWFANALMRGYDEHDRRSATERSAETLAQRFHETYERLAPTWGYRTRAASAKPWADVPETNKGLMVAVCHEVLAWLKSSPVAVEPPSGPRSPVSDEGSTGEAAGIAIKDLTDKLNETIRDLVAARKVRDQFVAEAGRLLERVWRLEEQTVAARTLEQRRGHHANCGAFDYPERPSEIPFRPCSCKHERLLRLLVVPRPHGLKDAPSSGRGEVDPPLEPASSQRGDGDVAT